MNKGTNNLKFYDDCLGWTLHHLSHSRVYFPLASFLTETGQILLAPTPSASSKLYGVCPPYPNRHPLSSWCPQPPVYIQICPSLLLSPSLFQPSQSCWCGSFISFSFKWPLFLKVNFFFLTASLTECIFLDGFFLMRYLNSP